MKSVPQHGTRSTTAIAELPSPADAPPPPAERIPGPDDICVWEQPECEGTEHWWNAVTSNARAKAIAQISVAVVAALYLLYVVIRWSTRYIAERRLLLQNIRTRIQTALGSSESENTPLLQVSDSALKLVPHEQRQT